MGNYEVFIALARARHAKRAFLATPVPRPLLEEILESAAHAPSSRNTQPWQVAVLTGESKAALSRRLCDEYDRGVPSAADFLNNPARLEGVYAERARAVGAATLAVKGIDRGDEAARRAHVRENFEFFNAPVEMIFHLAGDAVPGSFLALGCFLQNVMLGLTAAGLGSCPQYSVAGYGAAIRQQLGLPDAQIVVCGLAVGWVDPAAPINTLVPERALLAEYVRWFE
jgi:nitroreductase